MLCAALLTASACFAQDELPVAPVEAIDLRLDMASEQMRKAAWSRETSIYWALGTGLFTMLAADQSAPAYDHNLAVGLGSLCIGGFAVLQIKGARHDRKASRYLHHTE